mmetsp:Transcript_24561/g.77206  ORF Transcript_24561/g.77206 Transcript_24561/m.77206 type:complete len:378 (-) Transcript_24561:897-2030(-)
MGRPANHLIFSHTARSKHRGLQAHLYSLLAMPHCPRWHRADAVDLLHQPLDRHQLQLGLLQVTQGQHLVHNPDLGCLLLALLSLPLVIGVVPLVLRCIFARARHPGVGLRIVPGLLGIPGLLHLLLKLLKPGGLATGCLLFTALWSLDSQNLTVLTAGAGTPASGGGFAILLVQPGVIANVLPCLALLVPLLVSPEHVEDALGQRGVTSLVRVPCFEEASHDRLVVIWLHLPHLVQIPLQILDRGLLVLAVLLLGLADVLGLGGLGAVLLGILLAVNRQLRGGGGCLRRDALRDYGIGLDLVHLEMLPSLKLVWCQLQHVGPGKALSLLLITWELTDLCNREDIIDQHRSALALTEGGVHGPDKAVLQVWWQLVAGP